MAVFAYIILFCSFVVLYWRFTRNGRLSKNGVMLPPGPPGFPILGNLPQMVKKAPLKFSKWAQEYGKMYTVNLGANTPCLVVNDVPLMKQVFGNFSSTGKLWNYWFELVFEGAGLIDTEGKVWQEQRNFLVKTLKDFGFGSKVSIHAESMMLNEIKKLSARIEKEMETKGGVHLMDFMKECAGGTLWALVTGKNMTPEMVVLVEQFMRVTQRAQNSGLMFCPWLKYIVPDWSGYTEGKDVAQKLHALVKDAFDVRKREGDNYNDVMSAFVAHVKDMEGTPNSVFFGPMGEFHNIKTIIALLVAGVETTSTTLTWLLFYLCGHPEVQKKLWEEIKEEIGDREPILTDKERMPYAEAVILETLRLSSIVPLGLVHKLTDDIVVQGQTFPKGLCIMANTFHVHHDTNIWGDPNSFRPDRFLESVEDDGGNKSIKIQESLRESVVSFQPGRRTCVGEPLARDVIFMFLVKLCQTFFFLPDGNLSKEEYMERQIGLVIVPTNLGIRVERRK